MPLPRPLTYAALLALPLTALAPWPLVAAQDANRPAAAPVRSGDDQPSADRLRELVNQAAKSVVVVKYVWEGEADRRELEGLGLVVGDGLVAAPLDLVPVVLPDAQIVEFQILIPRDGGDPREVKATLQGRDERSNLVFIKADPAGEGEETLTWTPLKWTDGKPDVGEWVVSVGRLPEGAGYTPYTSVSRIAAHLRGPVPLIVAGGGGLTGTGSVVLNGNGEAVGLVERTGRRSPFLTGVDPLALLEERPAIFVPTEFYDASLKRPPTADSPIRIPYLGAERMTGLTKELREYYELGDRAAVQVGDVIEGGPAGVAGVKANDVIVALNGKPLERGDAADEQPEILNRTIARMAVGDEVTLTLLDAAKNQREVTAKLQERPEQVRSAERWYAQDLGFSVRELVFADRYLRKIAKDTPGVAVAYVREQGNAAAAGVRNGDLIRKLNQNDVQALADFRTAYEEFRKANPTQPVVLEVLRGSETQVLRIEAPR